METGIVGLPAPPLEDIRWIDESGHERGPLDMVQLGRSDDLRFWDSQCRANRIQR